MAAIVKSEKCIAMPGVNVTQRGDKMILDKVAFFAVNVDDNFSGGARWLEKKAV